MEDKKEESLDPLLQHFVDSAFKVAESQFREGKEVLPQIGLLGQDDEGMIFVPIVGDYDLKEQARQIVKYAWEKILADRPRAKLLAISVLVDTFIERASTVMEHSKRAGRFVPPGEIGTSQEVILLQLTLPDGDTLFQWPYVRVGKEVLFSGEPEVNEKIPAIASRLWPL